MNPKSIFFLFFFNRRSLPTDIALGIRTQKLACTRHDSSLVSSSPANFIFSFFLFFFFFYAHPPPVSVTRWRYLVSSSFYSFIFLSFFSFFSFSFSFSFSFFSLYPLFVVNVVLTWLFSFFFFWFCCCVGVVCEAGAWTAEARRCHRLPSRPCRGEDCRFLVFFFFSSSLSSLAPPPSASLVCSSFRSSHPHIIFVTPFCVHENSHVFGRNVVLSTFSAGTTTFDSKF